MMTNEPSEAARKWDAHYSNPKFELDWKANPRLTAFASELKPGRAIDLAMGIGQNVLWLARQGWRVEGVEISQAAIEHCRKIALPAKYDLRLIHADLTEYAIEKNAYDLVVCTFYLDRALVPGIKAALQKGGAVFLETFTRAHLKHQPGFNAKFVLEEGELKRMFEGFEVLSYRQVDDGKSAFDSLAARRK